MRWIPVSPWLNHLDPLVRFESADQLIVLHCFRALHGHLSHVFDRSFDDTLFFLVSKLPCDQSGNLSLPLVGPEYICGEFELLALPVLPGRMLTITGVDFARGIALPTFLCTLSDNPIILEIL